MVNFCFKRASTDPLTHDGTKGKSELFLSWDSSRTTTFQESLMNDTQRLNHVTACINNSTIDDTIHLFTSFMQDHAFKVFGKGKKNSPSRPQTPRKQWFNKECFDARKEFNRARNIFLKNRNDETRKEFLNKKNKYTKIKRKNKNLFMKSEGNRVSMLAKTNPKSFWHAIKNQYKVNKDKPCNVTVTDLYSHFYNLYGSDYNSGGGTNNDMTSNDNIILDDELDSEFTTLEIKEAVFSRNNSKSPGIDKLTAEVFKSSFDIISPFLTTFYNKLYNEGVFPKSWGEGVIVPIFKGGSQEAKNF